MASFDPFSSFLDHGLLLTFWRSFLPLARIVVLSVRRSARLNVGSKSVTQRFTKEIEMKRLRLTTVVFVGMLYVALFFVLAACQPVTRQPERPTLIEHKI